MGSTHCESALPRITPLGSETPAPAGGRAACPRPSRRGQAAMVLGRVGQQGAQLVILGALARFGGAESVGVYVTAIAICTPVVMFANLQLNVDMAAHSGTGLGFSEYLALRLLMLTAALAPLLGIVACWPEGGALAPVLAAVAVMKGVESVSDLCGAWSLRATRPIDYSRSLACRGAIASLAFPAALASGGGVEAGCLGTAAGWLLLLLVHDLPPQLARGDRTGTPGVAWRVLPGMLIRTLPLGLVSLLGSMELGLPRCVASGCLGLGYAGQLGVALALSGPGQLAIAALLQTNLPHLAAASRTRGGATVERRRMLAVAAGLGVAQTAILVVIGGPLQKLLFGGVLASTSVLASVSLGTSLLSAAAVVATAIRAKKRYWRSLLGHLGSLLVAGVVCLAASERGVEGIALSMIAYGAASYAIFRVIDGRSPSLRDPCPAEQLDDAEVKLWNRAA